MEENWVKATEKRIFYGMVKYSLEVYIDNWKKTGLKLQSREYSIEWLNIVFEVYIHNWKKTGLKIQSRE